MVIKELFDLTGKAALVTGGARGIGRACAGERSNQSSFFGMIYDELVPADHLLRKLAAAVKASLAAT